MVVGTKRDISDKATPKHKETSFQLEPSWSVQWPHLSLHNCQYLISSHQMKGVDLFLKDLEHISKSIFNDHSPLIPVSYSYLMDTLKSIHSNQHFMTVPELKAVCMWPGTIDQLQLAFDYLHAIGQVILLQNGLVCLQPQIIPKIMAQFISPEAVRNKYKKKHQIEIMNEKEIGVILAVSEGNNKEYV